MVEWGHDFRAAFKQLYWFKCEFPSVPVIVSFLQKSAVGLDKRRLMADEMAKGSNCYCYCQGSRGYHQDPETTATAAVEDISHSNIKYLLLLWSR